MTVFFTLLFYVLEKRPHTVLKLLTNTKRQITVDLVQKGTSQAREINANAEVSTNAISIATIPRRQNNYKQEEYPSARIRLEGKTRQARKENEEI